MERLKALLDSAAWMPFVLSAGATPKLSTARVLESIIIAAMAGAMSVWATTLVIQTDIRYIKQSQEDAKVWYIDTKRDLSNLYREFDKHNHKK